MAAIRNTNYYEMGLLHPQLGPFHMAPFKCGYRDAIDAVDADGCVVAPDGPGLGVEYDWDDIMDHCTDRAEYK
jgi:L-alanine-DL-glutamate epimerase-like enolase superfamily enzyme